MNSQKCIVTVHAIIFISFLLRLCFFIIFSDDLSFKKSAYESHTYIGQFYDASHAVDRNITTCTRTKDIGPNTFTKTVWWKVDLGRVYNIYSISIYFKNYDGYGMYNVEFWL